MNKKLLIAFIFLISIVAVSTADAARLSFSNFEISDQCPIGYELAEVFDSSLQGAFSCERIQTCDQYGNGWPAIGMDTEVDARLTLCGNSPQTNIVTASLTANPININSGNTSTLTWNSVNTTSCSGSGFLTGGSTSGSTQVAPASLTNYSVTCTGTTGSAISYAEVAVSAGVDLVPSRPSLNTGSLNGAGNLITFKSLVTNTGGGNVSSAIPSLFEFDINNDGSYDVTLTSNSLNGLNAGQSKSITSSSWTTVLGTHSVRVVVDLGTTVPVSSGDSNGCYTTTGGWSELIGTEGCSTSGGPNACGLAFDPQSYYATIGTEYTVISTTADGSQLVCPTSNDFCFDSGIGGETGSFNELRQQNMEGSICSSSSGPQGTIVFQGKQKDYVSKYGSLLAADMRANGNISIGSADVYTGNKTGGGSSTLDYMCKLIDPNSNATNFKKRSYNSPGNNSIFLWNGRSWEKHGARSYNSHVSGPFTCTSYEPPTIVTSGATVETNEINNYSSNFVFTVSQPQCSDGIDNDNDGNTDYPDDSNCSSAGDSTEGTPTQCSDGIDNDGDGSTDLLDGGCSDASDNTESDDPSLGDPQVEISASTTLVRSGSEVIISWTATDVNSCTVNGPSLSKSYSTETVSDQGNVEIDSRSTYTIICDTNNGIITDSVTVGIVPSFIEE